MIDPGERGAITRLHALGLLGLTGLGWFLAAALSAVELALAIRRRAALRTLQAGQATLFQLAAGLVLLLLVALVLAGFIVLGGQVAELPELPVVDPFSPEGYAVLAVWFVSAVALPVWYVWTLLHAVRATRASAAGEVYAYPLAGPLVWDEAPRLLRWLVVEQSAEEGVPEAPPQPGNTEKSAAEGADGSAKNEEKPLLESPR